MKNINYYLDTWTHWVWSYNYVYEDKLEHCPILDEPEESLDLMEAFCKIIVTEGKRRQKNHKKDNNSFENYSPIIQDAIQQVIRLISDGRDMHLTVDVSHLNNPLKTFNHHLDKNGLLPFENDPFDIAQRILNDIPEVREIIESDKYAGNFDQFINDKWYFFEGYESGSIAVRFNKINVKNNCEFTFDGDMVCFETVNGHCDGDGVIFHIDVENVSFEELPYYDDDIETTDDLIEWINGCKEDDNILTFEELSDQVHEAMDYSLSELN